MAAANAAVAAPKLLLLLGRYSSSSFGPANNLTASSIVAVHVPYSFFSSAKVKESLLIRALDPRRRDQEEDSSDSTGFNSENDLEYLGKVLAGSIVGGAVIKYGSIVFPEITRPNIILALTMIFAPVIIATLLLIKQSRAN